MPGLIETQQSLARAQRWGETRGETRARRVETTEKEEASDGAPSSAEDMSTCACAPSRARAAPRNAPALMGRSGVGGGGRAVEPRDRVEWCDATALSFHLRAGPVGHDMHRTNY